MTFWRVFGVILTTLQQSGSPQSGDSVNITLRLGAGIAGTSMPGCCSNRLTLTRRVFANYNQERETMKTQLKTIATAIIMALATTTTPAMASGHEGDPTGLFFGGGAAATKLQCETGFTCHTSDDTVPYFYGGFMGEKHFGVEFAYLGKSEYEVSTDAPDSAPNDIDRIRAKLEHSSLQANLLGRYPFNDHIAVFGKLGLSYAFTDENITYENADGERQNAPPAPITFDFDPFEDFGFLIGGGLEAQAGDFAARLSYNWLENDDVAYGELSILYRLR